MTTIAARFSTREFAADSMISDDSSFFLGQKLRVGNGCIYGAAGDWEKILKAYQLIESNATDWESDLDVEILQLRQDGLYVYESCIIPTKLKNDFWAIGTGAQWFMGAIHGGASFIQAMEIACANDTSSRGPIDYMVLEEVSGRSKSNRRRHNRGV